jgi:hypothetical protein
MVTPQYYTVAARRQVYDPWMAIMLNTINASQACVASPSPAERFHCSRRIVDISVPTLMAMSRHDSSAQALSSQKEHKAYHPEYHMLKWEHPCIAVHHCTDIDFQQFLNISCMLLLTHVP